MRRALAGVLLLILSLLLFASIAQAAHGGDGDPIADQSPIELPDGGVDAEPPSADLDKDVDTATLDFGAVPASSPTLTANTPTPRARGPNRLLRPPILA